MSDPAIVSFPLYLTAEEQTPERLEALKREMRERLAKPEMEITIDIQGAA